ncbi:dienelactone hydrolase family protein [Sandaracinus amylolyticus]|uniref:Dienelactone hydrolase family n=1 Tax=Sandaracinus amylolyticus TaxID=927083 RepID=A0A0F6YHG4_9BACT|nr:dienelactone hydrolase family protein [Sandaracinus amylolyticus]AKF03988.1 Dienelactone hydrolase family [Sandaracinus amylolyticus]
MSEKIRVADGVDGELATPAGDGEVPGLIVVHEWFGITDHVRALCDRLAAEGYLALAPDLYHGERATNEEDASLLMQKLSTGAAMQDVAAAVARLEQDPRCNGRIGIVGFCMGGAMAFAAAASVEGLRAAVPFYGIPIPGYFDASKVKCPIQAHFAARDEWATPARAQKFQSEVQANGGEMELHVYDAGHAFMREGDERAYDAKAANEAWSRALAYLAAKLKG